MDSTAGAGSGWANLGTNIAKFVEGIPGTSSEVLQQVGKFALDVVGKAVATSILQTMATEVINWAGSGFEGNPFAVENQGSHMYDIKSDEIVRLYNEVSGNTNFGGFTSAPAFESLMGVVNNELTPFTQKIKPTIEPLEKIDFKNDFTKGGWNTYIKQASLQNNPIGVGILTREELTKRVQQRQHTEEQKLLQGAGIQAATKCVGGFVSDVDTGFEYCKQEVVSTAGKLVGDQIGKAIGSSMDQSTQASASGDLGSIVSSMLSGLLTDLIYKGLGSIGGNSNPQPVDPFASLAALQGSDPNFQTSSNSKYNAREIVDINKELNTALELTEKDAELNLLAGINTLSGSILTQTIALDQCIPGPQLGYEDRLQRYFRVVLTADGLEEDAREDGGSLASFYSKVNMAFGEYLGKAKSLMLQNSLVSIEPRFDGPLQWIEQVNELSKHGTTLATLQDEYNEKQKVLIRLQSLKRQILNQSGQLDVILFNDTWSKTTVNEETGVETTTGLSLTEQESRFNAILSSFSVDPNDWETLPEEEKRRIARLFNENALNWSLDSEQKSRRLALYEMFNIPILNADGTINAQEPTPIQKRDAVIADGWKKWENFMSQSESSQEQRILIIRNLVESRNSYTTERSYDINKAKLEAVKASEERLANSIFSCQKARYEVVNANEVIPNKRILVLPLTTPESAEVLVQANITFSEEPSIELIEEITAVENTVYIQAAYERATLVWIEYSNYNNLDILPNSAINRSPDKTISRESASNGIAVISLSGNYNSAASNSGTFTVGDQDLSFQSLIGSSNSIYFQICAQNNLGMTCTATQQVQGSAIDQVDSAPETPTTQSYNFGEVLAGYNYFKPTGVTIPTPPGINNIEFSPAAITVNEMTLHNDGRVEGLVVSGGGANKERRLLKLKEGPLNDACSGALHTLGAIFSFGASSVGCQAAQSTLDTNVQGVPILQSSRDQWVILGGAIDKSIAIEVPFYQPANFITQTIEEGNPATHRGVGGGGGRNPGTDEIVDYPTYPNPPNPVIVVRNWHWDHEGNGNAVMRDYTRNHGCDFAGFGTGQAGTAGDRYFGPHCNATDDKDDYQMWYQAKSFDYLVSLYPRLKQFVR